MNLYQIWLRIVLEVCFIQMIVVIMETPFMDTLLMDTRNMAYLII